MNNSTLAHNWANKIKPSGKGSNMFYEGDTIYSYGYHFPIAKFITIDENNFVAYNYSSYSNSTSKHQAHVRGSIPYNYEVIKVIDMNFGYYGHERNIKHYISKIDEHFAKAKRSNKYKEFQLRETKRYINTLFNYIRLFKIDLNSYAELLKDMNTYRLSVDEYENSDIYKNWLAKIEQQQKDKEKNELIKQAENIVKFREFKINYVYSLPYNLLRFNPEKNEIQTSGGVNMAKDTFLRYYNMFKNDNLKIGEKVEYYQYGGKKDDIVFVGCHKFEINEINNLINSIPC
jgi:hypothetical protein